MELQVTSATPEIIAKRNPERVDIGKRVKVEYL
jgi:hypothetical protein